MIALGDGRDNKRDVVVVTGASAGVGRATVQAFARRGAQIGLLARGADGAGGRARRRGSIRRHSADYCHRCIASR